MNESLDERLPTEPGQVVVIDDATETIHAAQIRFRDTPTAAGVRARVRSLVSRRRRPTTETDC